MRLEYIGYAVVLLPLLIGVSVLPLTGLLAIFLWLRLVAAVRSSRSRRRIELLERGSQLGGR